MQTQKLFNAGVLFVAAVLLSGVFTAQPAQAVTITASELIQDLLPLDALNRDLQRIRTSSAAPTATENSDAIVSSENNVDGDFGIVNLDDVSYRHDLTWLNPPASTFLAASLTIKAFGVLGGNDSVYVDNINIGLLEDGLFTTTVFSSSNPVDLAILFADGYLSIFIDKNDENCFLNPRCLNALSVYSSELTVRYESEVPEPATMLLLGSGIAALGYRRRKRAI